MLQQNEEIRIEYEEKLRTLENAIKDKQEDITSNTNKKMDGDMKKLEKQNKL